MTAPWPLITSPSNPLIAANQPAKRRKAGLAYAEGERVVEEALAGTWPCKVLFLEQHFAEKAGERFAELAQARQCDVVTANSKVMSKLSGCDTAPPVGVIVAPPKKNVHDLTNLPEQLLVLDRVSDPGNVGALLRSAAAFGFSAVLTEGSVRLTNEKMIRASAGLCFRERMLLQGGDARELAASLRERGYRAFVLDPRGAQALHEVRVSEGEKVALVFGNEAAGVDRAVWGNFETIRIAMTNEVESLNVAASGAVALYELSRRRFA